MERKRVGKVLIVPKDHPHDYIPPNQLRKLHAEGPNRHNADMVIVRHGVEENRFSYSKYLEHTLNPDIPEVPVREVKEGKEVVSIMGEEKPPEIQRGAPPLLQCLYKRCDWENGLDIEEIVDILESAGWYENTDLDEEDEAEKGLKKLIKNQLITHEKDSDTYHQGPKKLEEYFELEKEGYDLEGPYPPARLARDIASERGEVKIFELIDIVFDGWNFTTSREAARYWIEWTIEKGYLKKVDQKSVEPFRSFE
jgi:hypothetical protein